MTAGRCRGRLRAPSWRFNTAITSHRTFEACHFELADLRRVKAAVPGATVNDVLLAVVGGALRQYLDRTGELPVEPLVAMVPISIRTADEAGMGGNRISAMTVSLGTNIAPPRQRLEAVHASASGAKAIVNAVGARELADYSQFVPGALAGQASRMAAQLSLTSTISPAFNTVLTNVPGPERPLYFAGARLADIYLMPNLAHGMGLSHAVVSYCGRLTLTVTACRDLMVDADAYADHLRTSFAELVAATT